MAKDLTYFKFVVSEWNDGDITTCSYAAQGLFVNLCSLYWSREGDLTLEKAQKKFPRARKSVWDELKRDGVVKISGNKLSITFLDEQLKELESLSTQNANNAKTGWKRRKSDAPASSRIDSASIPQCEDDAKRCNIDKIRVDNTYIQLCDEIAGIFGKQYISNPEERMPAFSGQQKTFEYQADRLLDAFDSETALKQVKHYKKYCKMNNRKVIGTDYKTAETILSSDWVKLCEVEEVASKANPYSEATHWKSMLSKDAWEDKYSHKLTTDNEFRKAFGYEQLRNGRAVGSNAKG